jgi:Cu+-exporting ATPase
MNDNNAHTSHLPKCDGATDTVPEEYVGSVYTCPMHPEVRSTEEGVCPKCNMALVIEGGTLKNHSAHGHNHAGHAHDHSSDNPARDGG